jgi:peptidoglycan/xylan/chitin deacetylase (PgdA/CDA1 family)
LQHALPEVPRRKLTKTLFVQYVNVDPATFAAELYMTPDQLRTMVRCGMYVGGHGVAHDWLNELDRDRQATEIDQSLTFLRALGASTDDWVMCYPYGAYNDTLLSLLKARGCAVGLTTRDACAQPGVDDRLLLPRLDTKEFPASD